MEQPKMPPRRPASIPPSMRRPAQYQQRTVVGSQSRTTKNSKSKKSFTFAMISVGIVSVLVIIGMVWWGFNRFLINSDVKGGQYQAVFLTNNMVYFGKISNISGEYVKLSDIYYLQVAQQGQKNQQQTSDQQPQLSLTKLGNELHGPEDIMYINRKEILFWENLKDDSKVVQTIKNYQQQGK